MAERITIKAEVLKALAQDIFRKAGLSVKHSQQTADALVWAEALRESGEAVVSAAESPDPPHAATSMVMAANAATVAYFLRMDIAPPVGFRSIGGNRMEPPCRNPYPQMNGG